MRDVGERLLGDICDIVCSGLGHAYCVNGFYIYTDVLKNTGWVLGVCSFA